MNTFAQDIDRGLSAPRKYTLSKYFYDGQGSRIFQQIMDMPEYYLTNCELEIIQEQSPQIYAALDFAEHFNIIELGAGDGLKTNHLLSYLVSESIDFTYIPVDISEEAMIQLQAKLTSKLPQLSIHPLVGDYFQVLEEEMGSVKSNNLFLFLGSNIGNYPNDRAIELLQMFNRYMKTDDKLLVGVDLQKNPRTIQIAYDDPGGITRAFNRNLLVRINRELGANFNLDQFEFYSIYNPENGEVRSYLVSLSKQEVYIDAIGKCFSFQKDELISTELSKKYTFADLEVLAKASGFRVQQHFLDRRAYFNDSLWVK